MTHRIFSVSVASVYPHYVAKAEKKGRTKAEVDEVIRWLTGYSQAGLEAMLEDKTNFQDFFEKAPALNPNRALITGVVCGIRVENIEEPLMRELRYLDKLIDELAKGKAMEKILRKPQGSDPVMAHWLVKSEPNTYSYADFEKDGRTVWDGVRNNAAALHLKAMAKGDEVLFYHSQEGKAVVGIAKVSKTAFPDASDPTGRFVAVELEPVRPLKRPVDLTEMKAAPALSEMVMLRQSRLSVSPVSDSEWAAILTMAGG